MKKLQQESYDGKLAACIEVLAPYQHISDGFYTWECGACGNEHNSRTCGWSIAGQVEVCQECGKVNLLVSTCIEEFEGLRKRKWAEESVLKELEELRGIRKYNTDQLIELKRKLWSTVEVAMNQVKGESK